MFEFKLKKLLYDRDMKRSDLSRKTKLDYNTIDAYYSGHVIRMSRLDLIKMCDALNCKLSDIIEYIPDKKKEPKGS